MLSLEASELLLKMLEIEMSTQVKDGRGKEPMSNEWLELYYLSLGLK